MRSRISPTAAAALALAVMAAPALSQVAGGFETPPVLKAADLVDPELLEGHHHQVDPEARNDGFMNHFIIRSDFGDFDAASEELLAVRVQEVAALAKLAEISNTEAFADALARSVAKPVTAVRNVITDPKGTVQGIPEGLNKRFRGIYYKAKKTGRKVKEEVQEEFEDDEPVAAGTGEPAPAGAPATEQTSTKDETVSTVKRYAGWDAAKRELARSLQIDPYSTNPVLQAELERLAGAAFAGGLTFKFAVPSVSGLSQVEKTNSIVWNTPPEELERLNDEALKAMGIGSDSRFAFLDNGRITISLQTRMVEALKRMSSTANRGALLELATGVEADIDARYFAGAADLLAGYHANIGRLSELVIAGNDNVGKVLAGVAEDGTVVVAAPIDYLIWQAGMEGGGPLSKYDKRQLWTTGRVSPRAREELAARGWTVRAEASFGS